MAAEKGAGKEQETFTNEHRDTIMIQLVYRIGKERTCYLLQSVERRNTD